LYKEIQAKSALNKIDSFLPYQWDLNIYRGCEHKCQYCFAQYSHKYMESDEFFDDIFVKTNIVEQLEKKLSSRTWKREMINIGGVTDSYQSAEEKYKFMPEIWKLMIKYKTPVNISTKSSLIIRDIDLINELSQITHVSLATSLCNLDPQLKDLIEPGASGVEERLRILREFKKTNVKLGWLAMPIIPYLTDSDKNLEGIFKLASEIGVDYLITHIMHLRGQTKNNFFNFLRRSFPELLGKYEELYKGAYVNSDYKNEVYKKASHYRRLYNVPYPPKEFFIPEQEDDQLSLF